VTPVTEGYAFIHKYFVLLFPLRVPVILSTTVRRVGKQRARLASGLPNEPITDFRLRGRSFERNCETVIR